MGDGTLFNHNIVVLICLAAARPSEGFNRTRDNYTHPVHSFSFWPLSLCSRSLFLFLWVSACEYKSHFSVWIFLFGCLSVPVHQPFIQSVSKSTCLPECPLFHFFLFLQSRCCCLSLHPSIMLPISHFHCQNLHLITSLASLRTPPHIHTHKIHNMTSIYNFSARQSNWHPEEFIVTLGGRT